jgi:transcriptional regulator with XRE-family HTH domain/tetratricopeptide (TPR) repeat protein
MGFTQEQLAAALGVDRTTVQRWESGERETQPWLRPRLAVALQVNRDELDRLMSPVPEPESPGRRILAESGDDMRRRELLRLFSMVATTLTMPASLVPTRAATRCGTVGIADHVQLNTHLGRVYALSSSKAEVLPLVRRQLDVLIDRLTEPHGPGSHRQLCALAGDLFQLAGEIFFDRDAYTDAALCYTLAAQASKDAHAYDLWATALTRHAYLSVYERRHADAQPMLDLAAALARSGDSGLSTRHWVAAVQAETHAGLGDLASCERALDEAEQVGDLTGPIHNGGWLRFDGTRLAEVRGTCYATLGRADSAEQALTRALRQTLSPRRRASVLADLAVIGIQLRDRDRVLTNARAALDEARATGSGMIGRKLADLRRHLPAMFDDARIRHLDDEIRTSTATARGWRERF